MYEDEENRIDENSEAKIKQIEEQLSDDKILELVQSGVRDLSSTLNKIDKETGKINSTFYNVGNSIQNGMINNLDTVISKLETINNMSSKIGFMTGNSVINSATGSSAPVNVTVTSNLTMNGTNGNYDDINKLLKKNNETLKNEINDEISEKFFR